MGLTPSILPLPKTLLLPTHTHLLGTQALVTWSLAVFRACSLQVCQASQILLPLLPLFLLPQLPLTAMVLQQGLLKQQNEVELS